MIERLKQLFDYEERFLCVTKEKVFFLTPVIIVLLYMSFIILRFAIEHLFNWFAGGLFHDVRPDSPVDFVGNEYPFYIVSSFFIGYLLIFFAVWLIITRFIPKKQLKFNPTEVFTLESLDPEIQKEIREFTDDFLLNSFAYRVKTVFKRK